LEHLVVEGLGRGRHQVHVLRRLVEVLGAAEEDVGDEEPPGVEAGQVALLPEESAHHEAGADEQHHRQRHFGDEEGAPPVPPPAAPRPPSFSTSLRSTRDARSAGRSPKTRLETSETATAKARTRASMWMWRSSSGKPSGTIEPNTRVPQNASTRPNAQPTSESI